MILNPHLFSDPHRASVSLHLPFDGADASTSFPDVGPKNKTATPVGNVQIDTAQSKVGGASGLFDGAGDGLHIASDTDFEFGSGDFTVEGWLRLNALNTFQGILAKRADSSGAPFGPFVFAVDGSNRLVWYAAINNAAWALISTPATTLTSGVWYHFAYTRQGTSARTFLDGALIGTGTLSGTLVTNASDVTVGLSAANNSLGFNGWLDELRVTKGVARYTATFTPPPGPLPRTP